MGTWCAPEAKLLSLLLLIFGTCVLSTGPEVARLRREEARSLFQALQAKGGIADLIPVKGPRVRLGLDANGILAMLTPENSDLVNVTYTEYQDRKLNICVKRDDNKYFLFKTPDLMNEFIGVLDAMGCTHRPGLEYHPAATFGLR